MGKVTQSREIPNTQEGSHVYLGQPSSSRKLNWIDSSLVINVGPMDINNLFIFTEMLIAALVDLGQLLDSGTVNISEDSLLIMLSQWQYVPDHSDSWQTQSLKAVLEKIPQIKQVKSRIELKLDGIHPEGNTWLCSKHAVLLGHTDRPFQGFSFFLFLPF